MKLSAVIAVLVVMLVLACSTAAPTPADPTSDIDATVEAKVAQERAVDATVQARVSATLSALAANTSNETQEVCRLTGGETVQSGWTGKDTGSNSCNSCFCTNGVLGCTKMACTVHQGNSDSKPVPTPQVTPTSKPTLTANMPEPTPTSVPTLSPTPTPFPQDGRYTMFVFETTNPRKQDELARLESLTMEELEEKIRADEMERALRGDQVATPTPIIQEGSYAGRTVRFKIGDSYAAETATWKQGGLTELPLSVESLIDGNSSTYREVSGGDAASGGSPPHLFTGKGYFSGNQVPLGTVVSAWIDGVQVSESTVIAEHLSYELGETSEMFSSLGVNLQAVWRWCQLPLCGIKRGWYFYNPDFETLGINTYTDAAQGDIVWVLVNFSQSFQGTTLYQGWNLIFLDPISTTASQSTLEGSVVTSFGDGTWVVGSDIQAGTYRSSETGSGCYWERLSGFNGEMADVIANEFTDAISVVDIASSDAGFSTERCGTWTEATSATTSSSSSPFGDGVFVVGLDIGPGTWTSPGGESCYWARLSGFSGSLNHIEINSLGGSNNILTIKSTDRGFESRNCGTWTKTG